MEKYEKFEKWYESKENSFHTSQLNEKEIAYSAYLKGMEISIHTIDDVHDKYNYSNVEYLTDDGESLKYGAYSIEEFIHWLKENDYSFTKNDLPWDLEDTLLKCWVVFETPDLDEKRKGWVKKQLDNMIEKYIDSKDNKKEDI